MSEPKEPTTAEKPPTLLAWLYDDVFLMFLLGVVVPFLFYTVWGFIELLHVDLSK